MSIQLKGGNSTEDQRLDRVIQFDEKSRNFPVSTGMANKKLRSYTWRCNEWYDQGREGACVAYALGHELAARPAEVTGPNDRWLVQDIYWEAQKIDPWDGGSYPGATPFYEGTSILAGVKTMYKKKFFQEYRWAFTMNDFLLGVGYNGPAVIGVYWYDSMYTPDRNGFIRPVGNIVGGHAIMVRAVNLRERKVTLRNSWGKGWGQNGDCYMTFDDMDNLLHQSGEAVFLKNRTAKFFEATF